MFGIRKIRPSKTAISLSPPILFEKDFVFIAYYLILNFENRVLMNLGNSFNECRYRHSKTESQQSQSTSTKRQRVLAATEVKTAQIPSWTSRGPHKLTAHCPPIQTAGPTSHPPPSGPLVWPSSSNQDQKPNSTRLITIRSRKKAFPTCFVGLMIRMDFGRGWNNHISIERKTMCLLVA